ncbi:MAG: hypothetical protein CM1200mP32_09460 [Methanobacteriota archaeon]|nr:MAG: hypothetical protein CM1200mP32_09460 [Euryarchaeota archaeon]
MRKVVLRWKIPSLRGAKELSRFLEVAERVEVLGHLAVSSEGVTQLVEIKMLEGHSVEEISEFNSFEVLEQHEEGFRWRPGQPAMHASSGDFRD